MRGRTEEKYVKNFLTFFKKLKVHLFQMGVKDLTMQSLIEVSQPMIDAGYGKDKLPFKPGYVKLCNEQMKTFIKWIWGSKVTKKFMVPRTAHEEKELIS